MRNSYPKHLSIVRPESKELVPAMTLPTYVQVCCLRGSLAGKSFAYIDPAPIPLPQPLLLGRGVDCHICLQGVGNAMVSRHHVVIQIQSDGVQVTDSGSTHGTYLAQTKERVSSLHVARGSQVDIQLGPDGPICQVAVGTAIPFGNYSLVAKLGEGGMAEVYVAADMRLDRFVVLKLLRPDLRRIDPLAEQHLLNEARIIAQLEHNNIVRIYELGELGGIPFIAMEYLRGISLAQLDDQLSSMGRRLPPPLAAAIVRQALLGLHAAHELPARVVHRDISHNNILITRDSVKVIDFGIARINNRDGKPVTIGNITKGCPPYMSPEQISEPQSVTRLSDIFSTAVVLYELCSGTSLFSRDTSVSTMAAVLTHEPRPLRSLCDQASLRMEELLGQALTKRQEERWPTTAAEFASCLKEEAGPHFLHHENIVSAVEQLGIHFHSIPPTPLTEEPELVRRSRPASRPQPVMPAAARRSPPPPPSPPSSAGQSAPNKAAGPPADRQDPLERAFERLDGGWIGIDAPHEMNVGRVHVIRAGAVRGLLQRNIAGGASDLESNDVDTMRLGRLLRLELLPDDPAAFTVRQLSPAEQPVLRSELTPWDWLVAPQQAGPDQTLRVVATNWVDQEGERVGKSHPVRVLKVCVRGDVGAGGIIGLPTAIMRWLIDRILKTDADLDGFCREHFPEIYRRFDAGMDRAQKGSLLLFLGEGVRIADILRKRDPQVLAQAEAQALAAIESNPELSPAADSLLSIDLSAKNSYFEISSSRLARLCITAQELHARDHREPIALPLELDGLVADCRRPLVLALSNRLVELRVASETLKAGRSFRIYPSELTTTGARNSYTLPLPCAGKQLFVGHHRSEHRVITVASSLAAAQESAPSPLEMSELGVRLLAPAGTDRLFVVYSVEPQRSYGHLACFVVRRE